MSPTIKWNHDVKLIISDVDETVADLYVDAFPEMIKELEQLFREGKVLFLVSGQSVQNIERRIVSHIKTELRQNIIVGHCSGAEVWGFNRRDGNLREKSFYSLYDTLVSESQKKQWREIIKALIAEFNLQVFPTMPIPEFRKVAGDNPLVIMFEDRGPQITFEMVNAYDLSPEQLEILKLQVAKVHGNYDLRIPILERAAILFERAGLPISARLAGVFAIDFVIKGISKTTAVKYITKRDAILSELGLSKGTLRNPKHIEVWGDKFSSIRGGTDRHISEALPKEVRSITFREENPVEFPKGYNIVVWDGVEHLHNGLLEFLKLRYGPLTCPP